MLFKEKIKNKCADFYAGKPLTLVFLGDSVTQGCFELKPLYGDKVGVTFESEYAYHGTVRKILSLLYPHLPVGIINAGISGDSAPQGLARLEGDVLSASPDLTVVCYGLNDSGKGEERIGEYLFALADIFNRLRRCGSEIIFLTPNMLGERINETITHEGIRRIAGEICTEKNQKTLDIYLDAAVKLCGEMSVPVCDCHKNWKLMKEAGVDVTSMLSNNINHPSRELHFMFAYELVKMMLSM